MSFEKYLKENARKIEEELDKILAVFLKETKKTNPKLLPFAKEFIKSCKGGKRIRGVLCNLGGGGGRVGGATPRIFDEFCTELCPA